MQEITHHHIHTTVKPDNGLATAALVLGCLTFVTLGATGIPALACGTLAIMRVKAGTSTASAMAWTGATLGALAVAGWTLFCLLATIGALLG